MFDSGSSQPTRNRKTVLPIHWSISFAALFVLVAYLTIARIPTTINWSDFAMMYWTGLALRAIFAAAILYIVQNPAAAKRCWSRYYGQPARFFLIGIIFTWLTAWQGLGGGIMNTVAAAAVAEFFDVRKFELEAIGKSAREVVAPAVYFFLGLFLVFAYNDVIVSMNPKYFDDAFLKIDSYILAGSSVSALARLASATLPAFSYRLFDILYFGMDLVVGGALLLIALLRGRNLACRYVGTLLMAYYGALVLFYLWPTHDPSFTCFNHFEHLPMSDTKTVQQVLAAKIEYVQDAFALRVDTDYFITFPCMHVALPFIAWWFCREWKRIARAMLLYNIVLIPAILLLEWHYAVDILGGLIVAALSVFMSEAGFVLSNSRVLNSEIAAASEGLRSDSY
jgi:PAP2 superfamily